MVMLTMWCLGVRMIFSFILLFYILSYDKHVINILPINNRQNRYLAQKATLLNKCNFIYTFY
jgi:hypothetical protein